MNLCPVKNDDENKQKKKIAESSSDLRLGDLSGHVYGWRLDLSGVEIASFRYSDFDTCHALARQLPFFFLLLLNRFRLRAVRAYYIFICPKK